jgi:hypothetical protein
MTSLPATSSPSTAANGSRDLLPDVLFLCFVVALTCMQVAMASMDPSAGVLSWSGDLLTDQGFHSKAAQLWTKFGCWSLSYNMDFRPAAPLFNAIMGVAFRTFGATVTTLAGYALVVNASTLLIAYAISRRVFGPWLAVSATVAFALCFPYFGFSRLAFIEPTAVLFSLLAILCFSLGTSTRHLVASVMFAVAAVFTKVHFITIVVAMGLGWLSSIRQLRRVDRSKAVREAFVLSSMALVTIAFGLVLLRVFATEVDDFRAIVAVHVAGAVGFRQVFGRLWAFVGELDYDTRLSVMVGSIALYLAIAAWRGRRSWRSHPHGFDLLSVRGRALFALAAWTIVGGVLIGSLDYRPSRYVLFLAFPLTVLGTAAASALFGRRSTIGAALVLLASMAYQVPLYARWWTVPEKFSKRTAYDAIAERIERESQAPVVPVIGQIAAELGLRSARIVPLEVQHIPVARYSLCRRLEYWKPVFYVGVQREPIDEKAELSKCPDLKERVELARYHLLADYKGELVLYRLSYRSVDE